MPTNKHKRKALAHSKSKKVLPSGLITSHPKASSSVGFFFVAFSIYLLIFEYQDNAMFGLAMISLIVGVVLAVSAKIAVTKKNKSRV